MKHVYNNPLLLNSNMVFLEQIAKFGSNRENDIGEQQFEAGF